MHENENGNYNHHMPQKVLCRQQRLTHYQLPIAIGIIESTKMAKGEFLHGEIYWDKGLVLDETREYITDGELMHGKTSEKGPFYTFRYDGESLQLFRH